MKKLSLFVFLVSVFSVKAQIGITVGGVMLNPIGGIQKSNYGLGLGVEFATDDQSTMYLNLSVTTSKTNEDSVRFYSKDFNISPNVLDINSKIKNTSFMLEGGNRRYIIGDAFDYGFGLYGGLSYQLFINRSRIKTIEDYDEANYILLNSDNVEIPKMGSFISGGIGFHAGVKHQFARGVVFLESSISYHPLYIFTNDVAIDYGDYSNVFFKVMLGYRKDIWN